MRNKFKQRKEPPVFVPDPTHIRWMHDNYMRGYPDSNKAISHRRTDIDELDALLQAIESKRGQELFPGLSWKTPIILTESPDDYKAHLDGALCLGVGEGINEHSLPLKFQDSVCCATYAAAIFGTKNDPAFAPITKAAELDDNDAKTPKGRLAHLLSVKYRLNEPVRDAMNWAITRIRQWYQELQSGTDSFKTWQSGLESLRTVYGGLVHDLVGQSPPSKYFDPLKRFAEFSSAAAPDALETMIVRALVAGESAVPIADWGVSVVQQWHQDIVNSLPETLTPIMAKIAKSGKIKIDDRLLPAVAIYTDQLDSQEQKYSEYLARFARWENGYNAAIVIQKDANGNVQIFPNERYCVRLTTVAQEIMRNEPDRWHYQYNLLLNSSLKHKRPPTQYTMKELVHLISRFAWIDSCH